MPTSKKRMSSLSPRKVQTEMTAFAGKKVDNKASPACSYAQAVSTNRFEPLSDNELEDDVEMEDDRSEVGSDTTPKQINAASTMESLKNPLSKKSLRKIAKASKKDAKVTSKSTQSRFLSSATKATLERARKAKETLLLSSTPREDNIESMDTITQEEEETVPKCSDVESEPSEEKNIEQNTDKPVVDEGLKHPVPQAFFQASTDSNSIDNPRQSRFQGTEVRNPYLKTKNDKEGIIHAIPQGAGKLRNSTPAGSIDKQIVLKKGMLRPHIHRYTLRIKIISSKSEGDEQVLVQKTLQNFFDIVLQGDPKSIIPPFFDLDRSDKSIPDLCSSFNVAALDSYYSLKRYFSRLSQRSEDGFV